MDTARIASDDTVNCETVSVSEHREEGGRDKTHLRRALLPGGILSTPNAPPLPSPTDKAG